MWGAIIAGGGALFGAASALSGAKKQKKINAMNADLTEQTNREEQRRLESDIIDSESLMGAVSAASGVQSTGSRGIAIADAKKENAAQLAWLKKSGAQQVKVAKAGGDLKVKQLQNQAISSLFSGASQIAGSGLFGKG
jgi:DNA-binding helix-hairpin-helix protein with protein kinase domain